MDRTARRVNAGGSCACCEALEEQDLAAGELHPFCLAQRACLFPEC